MFAKVFVFWAQAVLIQSVLSQCITCTTAARPISYPPALISHLRPPIVPRITSSGCGNLGYSPLTFSAAKLSSTNSGAFPVTSISAPLDGIRLASENLYQGTLSVAGGLPFLAAVRIEGVIPSAGKGAVKHSCGGRTKIGNYGVGLNAKQTPKTYPGTYPAVGVNEEITAVDVLFDEIDPPIAFDDAVCEIIDLNEFIVDRSIGEIASEAVAVPVFGTNDNIGTGNTVVAGTLPVTGETVVKGQLPIAGTVKFSGEVPARGTVSIKAFCSGNCKCPF